MKLAVLLRMLLGLGGAGLVGLVAYLLGGPVLMMIAGFGLFVVIGFLWVRDFQRFMKEREANPRAVP